MSRVLARHSHLQRTMRSVVFFLLGIVVFDGVSPARGHSQQGATQGATIFQARCARCHGTTGKTDTDLGRVLKVAPLTNDARLARMTPAEIVNLVKSDRKHRGVVHLEKADLEAAAVYVKQLAQQCEP
jgi:mono/diheme cytochrome c family protein